MGNLAGIIFGDFGQNAIFFNLVSFKFGNSRPRPPNVMSPSRCKPSVVVDQVPVSCDFKLRENLSSAHLPILALSKSVIVLRGETKLIGPTVRDLLLQECTSLATKNSFLEREESPTLHSLKCIQLS